MGYVDGAYREVNPLGRATEYVYDDRGNVVTTRGPDGGETHHARDGNVNLIGLSEALGLLHRPPISGPRQTNHRWIAGGRRLRRETQRHWTTLVEPTRSDIKRSSKPTRRRGATITRMQRFSAAPNAWPE
jgi:YD repeat-containing protein